MVGSYIPSPGGGGILPGFDEGPKGECRLV